MQWYRTTEGKYVSDFDRQQISEICLIVIRQAEHDSEARNCLAEIGLLTENGAFDWAELWRRERNRIKRLGWTPVRDCELPKWIRPVMGDYQPTRFPFI